MKTFKQQLKEKKNISAALILTDGQYLLVGRITGWNKWDLPKGGLDQGESPLEAVVRETFEETNLRVNPKKLEYLGLFQYNSFKDLHMFIYKTSNLPDVKKMKCTSTFINDSGVETLEIDKHQYIKLSEIDKYMYPNLSKLVKKVINDRL